MTMPATPTALTHDAPGNYSTHAIEFLLETRRRMIAAKHPFSKSGLALLGLRERCECLTVFSHQPCEKRVLRVRPLDAHHRFEFHAT